MATYASQLHEDIVGDVVAQIGTEIVVSQPAEFEGGKLGAVFGVTSSVDLVAGLVKFGLDFAVAKLGTTIEAIEAANRDALRKFIGDATAKFIADLAKGLEDAPTPGA